MSQIGTDYSWLSQQPRPRTALRRLTLLLLCLPSIMGAVWLVLGSSDTAATMTAKQPPGVSGDTPQTTQQAAARARAGNTQERNIKLLTATGPEATGPGNAAFDTSLRIEPSMLLALTGKPEAGGDVGTVASNAPATRDEWVQLNIRQGDTLSIAFARRNLSYEDSLAIAHLPKYGDYFVRNLRPGDTMKVKANEQGHVLALKYPLDSIRTLKVRATQDGYDARIIRADLTRRVAYATGVIYDSFYQDAMQAGLSSRQVMQIADIFKWTVNFGYDIHPGDRFTVVYSEFYKNGRKVTTGHILAVSLQTDSGLLRALRFTGGDGEPGYYRPDGTSLKRALLRSPVDYTRISSPFSMAREHPILHTVRAHEGIDYAAPMGTPIHAAGAGRIVSIGRNGGYGNMIAIDHGRGIVTRYGHMSRFASGLHVGSHVEQGEVIGYVGSTGLSTGPHLHFEIRIDGVPRNPQTVDLPGAPPLPEKYMDEFKAHIKPLIAQLETVSQTFLAKNEHRHFGQ